MKDVTLDEFTQALDEKNILLRDVKIVGPFVYGQHVSEGLWRSPLP